MASRFKLTPSGKYPSPSLPLRNEKHEDYCQAYIIKGVKLRAYLIGFGREEAKSSRGEACRVHKRPEVLARIAYLRKKKLSVLDIDDEILQLESLRLGNYNLQDIIDPKTNAYKPISEWPEDIMRCIKSIRQTTKTVTDKGTGDKITTHVMEPVFHGKDQSIERLMKHRGMFDKDNNQKSQALYLEVGRCKDDE